LQRRARTPNRTLHSAMMRSLVAPLLVACSAAELGIEDAASLVQVRLDRGGEGAQPHYWSGKNGDASRTGGSEFPMPVDLAAGPAWSWHDGGLVRAAPLIDGDKNIYLATAAGSVHKFSPDGQALWKFGAGAKIPDVPAIMGGALFATTSEGTVFSLNMSTGKRLWSQKAARASAGDAWSMTAAEGVVVAALSGKGKENDRLTALNATDGSVKWSFSPMAPLRDSISAVRSGSLVFSDCNGRAYRLSLADGSLVWRTDLGLKLMEEASDSTGGAVIGPDGNVYVTSNSKVDHVETGSLRALQFSDGKLLWRQHTDFQADGAAAVGRLGLDGPLAVVVAVGARPDRPDGLMQLVQAAPQGEKRGRVMAFEAASGRVLWRHELPRWRGAAAGDRGGHACLSSFGGPALSGDGTVFVGFQSGRFYGINDRNHDGNVNTSEVTSYNFSNAFQGSPGLAPGMLVATPCSGMHVFRAKSA